MLGGAGTELVDRRSRDAGALECEAADGSQIQVAERRVVVVGTPCFGDAGTESGP